MAAVRSPSNHTRQALRHPTWAIEFLRRRQDRQSLCAAAAVEELRSVHRMKAVDIVVANAEITEVFPRAEDAQVAELLEFYQVTGIRPVSTSCFRPFTRAGVIW